MRNTKRLRVDPVTESPLASRANILRVLARGAKGERFSRYPAGVFSQVTGYGPRWLVEVR